MSSASRYTKSGGFGLRKRGIIHITMTRLLEKLLAKTSKLPPEEQDALAARWLDELEDDAKWDTAFAASQDELATLASNVRRKINANQIQPTGIDEL